MPRRRPACPLLARLDNIRRRHVLARLSGRSGAPAAEVVAARVDAYLALRGVSRASAWAAHSAELAGLPHSSALCALWRRAQIHALAPRGAR